MPETDSTASATALVEALREVAPERGDRVVSVPLTAGVVQFHQPRGDPPMKVKLIENGPIVLDTEDTLAYRGGDASEPKAGPIFLCRCGQSATKPFCDGAHRKAGFQGPPGELTPS